MESERLKLRSNLLLSITETEPSFRVSRSELHAENYDINDDEVDGDAQWCMTSLSKKRTFRA